MTGDDRLDPWEGNLRRFGLDPERPPERIIAPSTPVPILNTRKRHRLPEIMDDPELDERRHLAALDGLSRINWATRSAREVWSAITPLLENAGDQPLRVLDIATGGGDLPIALSKLARRHGAELSATGCDISERALARARERARRAGAPVEFSCVEVIQDKLPEGFDVVTCSLFLHHLDPPEVRLVLEKMRRAASRLVVVCDLRRSAQGDALAWAGSRILSRSDVVHTDALLSARAAYTVDELRDLADDAGLIGAEIRRRAPYRLRLLWEKT